MCAAPRTWRDWEPWRAGVIPAVQPTRTNQYLVALCLFGFFFVALSLIGYEEYVDKQNARPLYVVAALCPAVLFFLYKLITARGPTQASLRLLEIPAPPGGRLKGEITLREPVRPSLPITLRLCCFRFRSIGLFHFVKINPRKMVRRLMFSTLPNVHRDELHRAEQTIPLDDMLRTADGFRVPVDFDLPSEAPEASVTANREVFVWIVKCRCEDKNVFEFADVWFGPLPVLRN